MACPYYRERAAGKMIGSCKDSRKNIPSKKHQDCLCQSNSGIYVEFCPIFAKLQKAKAFGRKDGMLKRIFSSNTVKQDVTKDLRDRIMTIR